MAGCSVCAALSVIGGLIAAKWLLCLISWLHLCFIRKNSLRKYKKAGDWALVTGASDGIGKAFAFEVAKRGYDVVLVSRTLSKLQEVAAEIAQKYQRQTKVIPFDFSTADDAKYKELSMQIASLNIAVLVNNVGVSYELPAPFMESLNSDNASLVKVNVEPINRMTQMVLPNMKEKRSGAIINLSSLSGVFGAPYLSVYAATKAYDLVFSNSLNAEVAEYGIHVLAVCPGMVISNMSKIRRESFTVVSARGVAVQSLNKLGGTLSTFGHWHHELMGAVMNCLPRKFLLSKMLQETKSMRKRALAKKERAATGK
jgi:17beta-estradiol 17-dehydrogenase / very-long-chain 3-oxoacyl-CoA reductase